MDFAVGLQIPHVSPSLAYRAFLDNFEGASFLRWWIKRFEARFPEVSLHLLCQAEGGEHEVEEVALECGVSFFQPLRATKLALLDEFARRVGSRHVAWVTFGFIFAPPDLLTRALAHHLAENNDFTAVLGLPEGTFPEIYRPELLHALAALTIPGLPSDPAAAVPVLTSAAAATGFSGPVTIRAAPLDASVAYGAEALGLPENVKIEDPEDLAIASRVVSQERDKEGPLGELELWRQIKIKLRKSGDVALNIRSPRLSAVQTLAARPRVLFVSNASAFSGSSAILCELLPDLMREGMETAAVVGAEGFLADSLRQGGALVYVAGRDFASPAVQSLRFLVDLFTSLRPNLIHLNYSSQPAPAIAAKLAGLPLVTHCRSAHLDGCGEVLRDSDLIITVSNFVAGRVICREVPPERVSVIWDTVNCRTFAKSGNDRREARSKLGIPLGAKVVLSIARFDPNKRHDLLLHALSVVKSHVPDLFLLTSGEAIGESHAYDQVNEVLDSTGMRGWCRMIPFTKDIKELHAASDVMILCSDNEGCGRCVAEAMAMEVPVITSDNGGTREIVSHGNTGFVVKAGDAGQLSAQILEVLREPKLCEQVGLAARRFAERELDSRVAASRVMALYDRLLRYLPGRKHTVSVRR